jgi:predicted MFS family arabinose efflux permease
MKPAHLKSGSNSFAAFRRALSSWMPVNNRIDGAMSEYQVAATKQLSPIEVTLLFTAFIASAYGFGIYLFASLAAEMRAELGLDYGTIGLATGIAQAGFLAASLLSGIWAPRLGPVRLILGAVAATAASLLLMSRLPIANPTLLLIGLLAVMGAGAAAVWVPMVAIAQKVIPIRHRAKALGLMSSGTSYGVFLNGLIIPPLVSGHGWRSVWAVVGCLAILLLIAGFWRLRGLAGNDVMAASVQPRQRPDWRDMMRPLALIMIATMFLNGLACMPFQTYLVPLLQDDLGQPVAFASRIWSVIGAIGMVSGFLLGMLADRISIKWAMVVTYLFLTGAAILILALTWLDLPVVLPMTTAGICFALAFYAIFGLVPAYISATFAGGSATLLFGFGNIALGLGGLIGNIVGGYTKEATGSFALIYGVIAVAAFLQIGLALVTPNERGVTPRRRS